MSFFSLFWPPCIIEFQGQWWYPNCSYNLCSSNARSLNPLCQARNRICSWCCRYIADHIVPQWEFLVLGLLIETSNTQNNNEGSWLHSEAKYYKMPLIVKVEINLYLSPKISQRLFHLQEEAFEVGEGFCMFN